MEKREPTASNLDKLMGIIDWTAGIVTYPAKKIFENFPNSLGAEYRSLKKCQVERTVKRFLKDNRGRDSRIAAQKYLYSIFGQEYTKI